MAIELEEVEISRARARLRVGAFRSTAVVEGFVLPGRLVIKIHHVLCLVASAAVAAVAAIAPLEGEFGASPDAVTLLISPGARRGIVGLRASLRRETGCSTETQDLRLHPSRQVDAPRLALAVPVRVGELTHGGAGAVELTGGSLPVSWPGALVDDEVVGSALVADAAMDVVGAHVRALAVGVACHGHGRHCRRRRIESWGGVRMQHPRP